MHRVPAVCCAAVVALLVAALAPMPVGAASRGSAAVAAPAVKAAAPSVTSVTGSGPTSGGNTVTVLGTGFVAGATVSFDGAAGTGVRVLSATRLTVIAPRRTPATVDVRVRTTAGISPVTSASRYTYVPVPVQRLTHSAVRSTSVSLAWQNPRVSPGFSRIMVRRLAGTVAPATPTQGTLVALLPHSTSTYTDTGLTADTSYSYAVFAKAGVFSPPARITLRTTVSGFRVASTIPLPADSTRPVLEGFYASPALECPSAGWCLTVNQYERSDGSALAAQVLSDGAWSATRFGPTVASSARTFLLVNDVACRDRESCLVSLTIVTVDVDVDVDDYTFIDQLWRLDGTTWSVMASPRPAEAGTDLLASVFQLDCVQGSDCVALGGYLDGGDVAHSFTARWNGAVWTTRALPDRTVGGVPAYPYELACRTATSCVASGIAYGEDEIVFVGGSTSARTRAATRSVTRTADQRTTAGTRVMLPGSASGAPRVVTREIAERIVGTAAVRRAIRQQGAAAHSVPKAVSSAAETPPAGVVFRLEGAAWTAIPLTLPANADAEQLVIPEVSCSQTFCLAYATYGTSDFEGRTLALITSGPAGWTSREPVPVAAGSGASVVEVTCVASTCHLLATTSTWDESGGEVLATTTGGAWSRRPAPLPVAAGSVSGAQSVGCRSAISCVLVGYTYRFTDDRVRPLALITPARGAATPVVLPDVPAAVSLGADVSADLGSVTCSSARDCVAIGTFGDGFETWGLYSVAIRFDTAG